jgi:DNA-binding PadR family transcriptional regulator
VRLRAGSLYTVIRRFVDDGLIQESSERPDPALDDERRRYYRLTDRGRAVAVAEARRMADTLAQARAKLGVI